MSFVAEFFTERGIKTFYIILGCTAFAILFLDPLLAGIALIIVGFVLYDYKKAKDATCRINDLVKLNPSSVREVLVAGQKKGVSLSCQVMVDLPINLSSPLKEVKLKEDKLRVGKYNLELLLSSDTAGEYKMDRLQAKVFGPYQLVKRKGDISFSVELKVFPRVMVALVRAARYLMQGGRGGTGDVPVQFKGAGTEYADTREYFPGDTLHHIDWKATARQGKLMVKEFFLEAGRGAHIVYDTRAAGAVSQDKLASCFLNSCLGIVEQGYPVGVTVHDGKRLLLHCLEDNPRQVLKMAMGYVLESMKVPLEDVDILIDPVSAYWVRRFLGKVREEGVRRMLEFEAKILQNRVGEPYKFLSGFSRKTNEERHFLLISQLAGEVVEVLQLADEIKRQHQLTIIQPTEPWREAEGLEDAYRWYERIKRVEEILGKCRIRVVTQLGG